MRTMLLLVGALAAILIIALLVMVSSAGTIPYTVTGKSDGIEYRHYPELVLATVDSANDDAGFSLLLAYISGSNRPQEKIPMTAPVISSQKIPMTAPVVSDEKTMSFVMPAGTIRDETPDPIDSRVRIAVVPERDIAVLRFSGYAPPEDVEKETSRLLEGLKNEGVVTTGQPFLMRYDAPWTPGFLRRNEVAIEIRQ
jgi:hypothetical protein